MVGKILQIGSGNFDETEMNKEKADDSAEETSGEEKSLEKRNPGSQKHADQKHACQPAENQHGFEGKRGCCHCPLVLLLFKGFGCRTNQNKKKTKTCQFNNDRKAQMRPKDRSTKPIIVFDISSVIQHIRKTRSRQDATRLSSPKSAPTDCF